MHDGFEHEAISSDVVKSCSSLQSFQWFAKDKHCSRLTGDCVSCWEGRKAFSVLVLGPCEACSQPQSSPLHCCAAAVILEGSINFNFWWYLVAGSMGLHQTSHFTPSPSITSALVGTSSILPPHGHSCYRCSSMEFRSTPDFTERFSKQVHASISCHRFLLTLISQFLHTKASKLQKCPMDSLKDWNCRVYLKRCNFVCKTISQHWHVSVKVFLNMIYSLVEVGLVDDAGWKFLKYWHLSSVHQW